MQKSLTETRESRWNLSNRPYRVGTSFLILYSPDGHREMAHLMLVEHFSQWKYSEATVFVLCNFFYSYFPLLT